MIINLNIVDYLSALTFDNVKEKYDWISPINSPNTIPYKNTDKYLPLPIDSFPTKIKKDQKSKIIVTTEYIKNELNKDDELKSYSQSQVEILAIIIKNYFISFYGIEDSFYPESINILIKSKYKRAAIKTYEELLTLAKK